MSDWKSIDTAPLDGTWVMLTGGIIDYGWDSDDQPPCVIAQWAEGGWQFAWYDAGYFGEYEDPTHWQPTPAMPES